VLGAALLGTGATILWAQPPQPRRDLQARIGRDKLRAEIVKLEVEMLRFDYERPRRQVCARPRPEAGAMTGGRWEDALETSGPESPSGSSTQFSHFAATVFVDDRATWLIA